MGDVAGVEVLGGQRAHAAGHAHPHGSVVSIDSVDGSSVAIANVEAIVVPEADDLVTGLVVALLNLQLGAAHNACSFEVETCPAVEVVDIASSDGQHHDLLVALACGPPIVDHGLADVDTVRSGDQSPVRLEGVEGPFDVAGSQFVQRLAFPLVALATVLGERDRVEELAQRVEHPAGFDFRELARIADQHDLRPDRLRCVEDRRESPSAGHPADAQKLSGFGDRQQLGAFIQCHRGLQGQDGSRIAPSLT